MSIRDKSVTCLDQKGEAVVSRELTVSNVTACTKEPNANSFVRKGLNENLEVRGSLDLNQDQACFVTYTASK